MTRLDQLQITEDAIYNERNREHHGMVCWEVRRRKCVKRIRNDGHTGHDGDVLIEQRDSVSVKHLTMRAGALCKQIHFRASFPQTYIKREQYGDHIQPWRKPFHGD